MAKKAPASFNLLDHLEKETKVKPFTAIIDADGTEITFPNPLKMQWKEAQRFMDMMSGDNPSLEDAFKVWLSDEDFAALNESPIATYESLMELAKAATEHYSASFGTPGE